MGTQKIDLNALWQMLDKLPWNSAQSNDFSRTGDTQRNVVFTLEYMDASEVKATYDASVSTEFVNDLVCDGDKLTLTIPLSDARGCLENTLKRYCQEPTLVPKTEAPAISANLAPDKQPVAPKITQTDDENPGNKPSVPRKERQKAALRRANSKDGKTIADQARTISTLNRTIKALEKIKRELSDENCQLKQKVGLLMEQLANHGNDHGTDAESNGSHSIPDVWYSIGKQGNPTAICKTLKEARKLVERLKVVSIETAEISRINRFTSSTPNTNDAPADAHFEVTVDKSERQKITSIVSNVLGSNKRVIHVIDASGNALVDLSNENPLKLMSNKELITLRKEKLDEFSKTQAEALIKIAALGSGNTREVRTQIKANADQISGPTNAIRQEISKINGELKARIQAEYIIQTDIGHSPFDDIKSGRESWVQAVTHASGSQRVVKRT